MPPSDNTPQGDTTMVAPCVFTGPEEDSGVPEPSARSVQPLLVEAADAFPRRQRSDNAPRAPVPAEIKKPPSTTAAVWWARGGGGDLPSLLVTLVHLFRGAK